MTASAHRCEIDVRDTAKPIAGTREFRDPIDGRRYVFAGADHIGDHHWCSGFPATGAKLPVSVEVHCPPDWTVVGIGTRTPVAAGRWRLASDRPLAPHLIGVAAGPMYSVRSNGSGVGWYARASLADRLDRDAAGLTAAVAACTETLETLIGTEFPWLTRDFVFVPGARRRAMEYPGGVQLRESLLPAAPAGRTADAARVMVLAHELAHMWFGNLVTPRSGDDVWLFEALAEMLGQRTARTVAGEAVRGVVARRRMAALRAAHRSDAPALGEGGTPSHLVDYVKGAAALADLRVRIGSAAFTEGLHTILTTHRDGVATAGELIAHWAALDRGVVARWRHDWLGHRGRWRQTDVDVLDRRAAAWSELQRAVADGDAAGPMVLDEALAMLVDETEAALFEAAATWIGDVLLWRLGIDGEVRMRSALERVLADPAVAPAVRASALRHWIGVADHAQLVLLRARVSTTFRWLIAARLAILGELDDAEVAAMAAEDRSAEGTVQAARCRAALPGLAAKERAWRRIVDATTPVAERVAAARVFFHPRHSGVTTGFVPEYFAALLQGGSVAEILAHHGFPFAAADPQRVSDAASAAASDRRIGEAVRSVLAANLLELHLSRRWPCVP